MQRAVLVITATDDDDKMSNLVWDIAEEYGDESVTAVAWSQVDDLPEWVNVSMRDQLTAHKRDSVNATFMLVWLGTDEEIEGLTEE